MVPVKLFPARLKSVNFGRDIHDVGIVPDILLWPTSNTCNDCNPPTLFERRPVSWLSSKKMVVILGQLVAKP